MSGTQLWSRLLRRRFCLPQSVYVAGFVFGVTFGWWRRLGDIDLWCVFG